MSNEKEIFEGKTFQDLTKDIYENTTKRKTQIDLLISEIHGFITTIDDVVLVAPIIKEYMKSKNIRMVIDKKSLLLADENLDITKDILALLNKQLKSIKIN